MSTEVDVLVIGGGPSGTAASIVAARYGLRVALLERTSYEDFRIGETLPPEAKLQLEKLGVWDNFLNDGHIASPGNVSVWGSDVPYENNFIFNPYGEGWHVDRRRLDQMFAHEAESLGVFIHCATKVVSCTQLLANRWLIRSIADGHEHEFAGRYLIDASGRRSLLASQRGIKKIVFDRLVGVIAVYAPKEGAEATEISDLSTMIESAEVGWWYSAPVPGNKLIVAFMTDSDLLPPNISKEHFWVHQIRKSVLTQERVRSYYLQRPLRCVSAASYTLQRVAGSGWIAVGDAAAAFDPLSSSGLVNAMESGIRASQSIIESDDLSEWTTENYEVWVRATVDRFLRNRSNYYEMERRWPDSRFWYRRRGEAVPD